MNGVGALHDIALHCTGLGCYEHGLSPRTVDIVYKSCSSSLTQTLQSKEKKTPNYSF